MCAKSIWFSTFGGLSWLVKENTRRVSIWYILTSKRFWDCSTGLCFRHKLRKHGLDVIMKWVHNSLINCSQKYLPVVFCQTKRASQAGSCRGQSLAQFYSTLSYDLNVGLQNTLAKIATITKPGKLQALGRTALGVKTAFTDSSKEVITAFCQLACSSFGLFFI